MPKHLSLWQLWRNLTFNKNVHSPLSTSWNMGNKLYRAPESQEQILVLPSPFYIPEDAHSHILSLSRRHYYKNYLNDSQLLLSKLQNDLGKYFQSVISISSHLGVHERIHQTVAKSAYELFQHKTQNTMEELGAIWNTSLRFWRKVIPVATNYWSFPQLFSIKVTHTSSSGERTLSPNQTKLLL